MFRCCCCFFIVVDGVDVSVIIKIDIGHLSARASHYWTDLFSVWCIMDRMWDKEPEQVMPAGKYYCVINALI